MFGGGGSIFEELFGGGAHDPDAAAARASDLRYDMEITFEEAANGCEKEITVNKLERCDVCHGTGAESGSKSKTCPTCGGRGQVISSRGIFSIAQTCPRCEGRGPRRSKSPARPARARAGASTRPRSSCGFPPGVDTGSRLRSTGNGEAGVRGGPAGDLYVVLHVRRMRFFNATAMI